MSARMTLGQTAEIAGPKKANIFPNAKVASALIKRATRPLLVVGSESVNVKTSDGDLVDSAIRLLKNEKITIVATAHMIGEFRRRGADKVNSMSLFVLGKSLSNPDWMGFDGKGPYDTVIFMGFTYYMEWLIQSGLKNFAMGLRTISLDRTYQPNAEWSIGWMPEPDWLEALDTIISSLEEDK
jgi:acetyl-CoA decarbonylase/synthase complex subunit epsilon